MYCLVIISSLSTAIANRLEHKPTDYFKNLYFDAISYHPVALQSLVNMVGSDRIMFGTDNPFFPPVGVAADKVTSAQWDSTVKVQHCIEQLNTTKDQHLIFRDNAKKLFNI